MAGNSLAEQFRELEAASTSYAEQATRLSHLIVTFEKGLNSLAGKIPFKIADEKQNLFVSFSRNRDGAWKLSYRSPTIVSAYLTEAPIDVKIECIALFPAMVKGMTREFLLRQARVELASEPISPIVELLQKIGKEGA